MYLASILLQVHVMKFSIYMSRKLNYLNKAASSVCQMKVKIFNFIL